MGISERGCGGRRDPGLIAKCTRGRRVQFMGRREGKREERVRRGRTLRQGDGVENERKWRVQMGKREGRSGIGRR